MEQGRIVIAIVLSILVFVIWDFFFSGKEGIKNQEKKDKVVQVEKETQKEEVYKKSQEKELVESKDELIKEDKSARIITVNTPLYSVKISEKGALFKSFVLKKYREAVEKDYCKKE